MFDRLRSLRCFAALLWCFLPVASASAEPAALSVGANFSCALQAGQPLCWGRNQAAQLGDGTRTSRFAPVPVAGFPAHPAVVALSSGALHTCALLPSGALRCWGLNDRGQLGDGSSIDRDQAVAVSGMPERARQVSAGGQHSCAVAISGRVYCWGSNASRQLGNLAIGDRLAPAAVDPQAFSAIAVAAGGQHSCALARSGEVFCWGGNSNGQTGDPGPLPTTVQPRRVEGLGGPAVGLAAGNRHSCALLASGAIDCWGDNFGGQLGSGSLANPTRAAPVQVAGLDDARTLGLGAGSDSSCAARSGGELHCWGAHVGGICATISVQRFSPERLQGLADAALQVRHGADHGCALLETGRLHCWGNFLDGRLGVGEDRAVFLPQQIIDCGIDQTPGWQPQFADSIFRAVLPVAVPGLEVGGGRLEWVFSAGFEP